MITIEKGAVEAFLENLQMEDVKLIENSLGALHKTLEHGENMSERNGGVNFVANKVMENGLHQPVENLIRHPDENIALKAELLFQRFFF